MKKRPYPDATSTSCKSDERALPADVKQGAAQEHLTALLKGLPRELKLAVQALLTMPC